MSAQKEIAKKTVSIPSAAYPSEEEVRQASHEQLCRWYRFLRSPENADEREILDLIVSRYKDFGGMTPEISKSIGWGK